MHGETGKGYVAGFSAVFCAFGKPNRPHQGNTCDGGGGVTIADCSLGAQPQAAASVLEPAPAAVR
jgi:hypothetical protein